MSGQIVNYMFCTCFFTNCTQKIATNEALTILPIGKREVYQQQLNVCEHKIFII